jgi:hypothetical protein
LGITWVAQSVSGWRANRRALSMLVLSGLPSLPMLGYQVYVFGFDPFYRAWAAQNVTRSPGVLHYLLGYAVLLVLAIAGAIWVVRRGDRPKTLLLVWLLLTPLLVYLPVPFQRRFLIGYQLPLAFLAALGLARYVLLPFSRSRVARWLCRWPRYSPSGMRKWIATALVVLLSASNLILVTGSSVRAWARSPQMFHARTELDALDWLELNADLEDVVLSAFDTGNFIPAQTGHRVFLGHGPETVRSEEKKAMVARFFEPATADLWRRSLLETYDIAYVVVGPRERQLGEFAPHTAPYLSQVYANSDYQIYQVVQP